MIRKLRLSALLLMAAATPGQAAWNFTTVAGDGGVPLSVVTVGDAAKPAILLIHGLGQSHYSFVHQLNSDLADDYYLVSFDLRGHGASGKPWAAEAYTDSRAWARDVDAVMNATGLDKPVVLGWSYGTLVLMDYIREFGTGRLSSVVLTGALGGIVPFRMQVSDDPRAATLAKASRLRESPDFADRLKGADIVVDLLTAKPVPPPYRQLFMMVGFMFPNYARVPMTSRSLNNEDLLDALQLPVLLAMGSKDNEFLLIDGTALSEQRANFSVSAYEGAGHSVFFEMPERFNAELREFASATHTGAPGAK